MKKAEKVLPQQFLLRLQDIIPNDFYKSVLDAFCSGRSSTFRANTLKISGDDLEKRLHELHITAKRVPWYRDAFILQNQEQKVLTETQLYKDGFIYLQNLSSMIPPLVLDPQPDEKILDITAAPGSKTTQIAALMRNTGQIIANDKSRIRLYKLEANLKMQGVTNTTILQKPGQMLWKLYPEYFDRALVDVPCSMEGRFDCSDEKSFKDWSYKKIKVLVQIQRFLLRSAVSATKPGGYIVYATCTLSPEENEEIIDWILKKEGKSLSLENISFAIDNRMEGLVSWKNRTYDSSLNKTMRVLPSQTMEGFFVAKLKKNSSTIDFKMTV